MKCRFLQETQVEYCRVAAVRKMIAQRANPGSDPGRCATPEHVSCSVYSERAAGAEAQDGVCPFLTESAMQFCAAAPMTKFVPSTEESLTRCGTEAHRYCGVFLDLIEAGTHVQGPSIEGLPVPERLTYTPNHFWLDPAEDGPCHMGLDAFAARLLRPVERVSFLTSNSARRAAAVLTVRGVDVHMVFPSPVAVQETNVRLRPNPDRITTAPYTHGWLFAGETQQPSPAIPGREAAGWMREEIDRLNRWTHDRLFEMDPPTAADGGVAVDDLLAHLDRDAILQLFDEFFSPFTDNKRSS